MPLTVAPIEREPCVPRKPPRFGVLLRRFHMYLALFLTPWLTMYALSTAVFNHFGLISKHYGGRLQRFEPERQVSYPRDFAAGTPLRVKGEQILADLHLSGSFGIQQRGDSLVIDRRDPLAPRRLTYFPRQHQVVIERQAFRTANFLTTLHSQVSYVNRLARIKLWAVSVDLTALAMLLLVFSGFWMWWELKVTRGWGWFCTLFGVALFGIFVRFA